MVKPELLEEPTKANTDSQPYPDPYNLNFQGWSMESADSPPVVLKHDSFKYENLFKKKKSSWIPPPDTDETTVLNHF